MIIHVIINCMPFSTDWPNHNLNVSVYLNLIQRARNLLYKMHALILGVHTSLHGNMSYYRNVRKEVSYQVLNILSISTSA